MVEGTIHLRAFNRFYTQHIGVLNDRYLGQDRPLAEARLLFEIGPRGTTVRELRQRLGLDSGYLSRLLRSLQSAGLIETAADLADGRARTARPTPMGRAELAEMNRRADADTSRVLEGLEPSERQELLGALATIERLLRRSSLAADVTIRPALANDADAVAAVLAQVFADQRTQFTAEAYDASTPPAAVIAERISTDPVWVAEQQARIVGTVSAAHRSPALWIRSLAVMPQARGARLGTRLLTEAQRYALDHGFDRMELDTTPFQTSAAMLYERFGFQPGHRHELHGTPMIRMTKPLGPS
jgi:DNA-binding MarR family transcriptional regulator/GNAT superfamily N-acetyltransferase